jgi:twitching motility protein PilT
MARIDSFLRLVVEQRASDLHFSAGTPPVIRHDGQLVPLPFRSLGEGETRRFLAEILTTEEREQFDADLELDLVYSLPDVARFRVNLFHQQHGWGAAFRVIPDRPPRLDDLGFPSSVRGLCKLEHGLVLIGGPTGAGKSTTLAAIVDEINRTARRHIVIIEDPIEFLHEPVLSAVTQRQVGTHVESLAEALRSAQRESADVIVVGEIRDGETMALAIQAAETGVLVFGTMHTPSASKTISRAIDLVAEDAREQVRSSLSVLLRGVVAQHLLRRASGDGRIAAAEILLHNQAVATMIRDQKTAQIDAYLQGMNSSDSGMRGLENCLLSFVRDGLVDIEEAAMLSVAPDALRREVARALQEGHA